MALVLVATPGATNANSYEDVTGADAYFLGRVGSANWEDLDTEIKEQALVHATGILDYSYDWHGYKTDEEQALDWPRAGVYDKNDELVDDDVIPTRLANCTSELAFSLTETDRLGEPDAKGIRSMKAGSLSVEFDKRDTADVIPDKILSMIWDLGELTGSTGGGVKTVYRT